MFRGHPLAVSPKGAAAIFYGAWPAMVVAGAMYRSTEVCMKARLLVVAALLAVAPLRAADVKVDLSKEQVGKPPATFEADGRHLGRRSGRRRQGDHGRRTAVGGVARTRPTKLLVESARSCTAHQRRVDGQRQTVRLLPGRRAQGRRHFSNGTISLKFKTIAGDADRASGILFNVKPNGDWLAVRYNDTENNVALWEFHNGIRRTVPFQRRAQQVHARSGGVARTEADGRRRQFQDVARRRARARIHARQRARTGTRRRRAATRICSRRTTPCCVRPCPARSACGRRPTARVTSKITS